MLTHDPNGPYTFIVLYTIYVGLKVVKVVPIPEGPDMLPLWN